VVCVFSTSIVVSDGLVGPVLIGRGASQCFPKKLQPIRVEVVLKADA